MYALFSAYRNASNGTCKIYTLEVSSYITLLCNKVFLHLLKKSKSGAVYSELLLGCWCNFDGWLLHNNCDVIFLNF